MLASKTVWPKLRVWLLLCGLLALYCYRDSRVLAVLTKVRSADDLIQHSSEILRPPWRALSAYVAADDHDIHLYYEFTRLFLGEDTKDDYVFEKITFNKVTSRYPDNQFSISKYLERLHNQPTLRTYPPIALGMMLLPRLVTDTLAGYRIAYAALAGLLYLGLWWLGLRIAHKSGSGLTDAEILSRALVCTAALGPIVVARFDVLPALWLAAALERLLSRRPLAAAVLLLLGASTKLYPLLLVPTWAGLWAGFAGVTRQKLVRAGLTLFALLVGLMVVVAVSWRLPGRTLESIFLFGARPIQIESLLGAVMHLAGAPVLDSFGSKNVEFPGSAFLAAVWTYGMVVWCLGLGALAWWWSSRQGRLSPSAQARALCMFTTIAILGILLSSKVFSPQYLIWCLPTAVLLPGADGRFVYILLAVSYLLTQVYFPIPYDLLTAGNRLLATVVVVRNLCLVYLLAYTVRMVCRYKAHNEHEASSP